MYLDSMTYEKAMEQAESIKNLGIKEVYLNSGVLPWELVTRCEPGGSHRLEISTDVWFYAYDSKNKLNYKWSYDLEPRSANGSNKYHINIDGTRNILALLSGDAQIQFRQYLADCAVKIKNKGYEWMKVAIEQQVTAAILQDLTSS